MRAEEWERLIEEYKEYMARVGYTESTIRTDYYSLKRLLREFGTFDGVDEETITRRYWRASKHARHKLVHAYRNFKRWLTVVWGYGQGEECIRG